MKVGPLTHLGMAFHNSAFIREPLHASSCNVPQGYHEVKPLQICGRIGAGAFLGK